MRTLDALHGLLLTRGRDGTCYLNHSMDAAAFTPGTIAATRCTHDTAPSFAAIVNAILRHQQSWMLFVGDSDTRALVLQLFQILAAGFTTATPLAVLNNSKLFIGDIGQGRHVVDDPNATEQDKNWAPLKHRNEYMRLCLLDLHFDATTGSILRQRTVPCIGREEITGPGQRFRLGPLRPGYLTFGKDYDLLPPPDLSSASVKQSPIRITFVGTAEFNQTMTTLQGLTAHVQTIPTATPRDESTRRGAFSDARLPTALYVGLGAWLNQEPSETVEQVTRRGVELAEALDLLAGAVPPPRPLIFASVLGQFNRNPSFSERFLTPHLLSSTEHAQRWRVFNRTANPVSWNTTRNGRRGLHDASGHAPPIVNFIDWQRLVSADVFAPNRLLKRRDRIGAHENGERSVGASATTRCVSSSESLEFSEHCAGFEGVVPGGAAFMEAYFHFCWPGRHT